MPDSQHSSASKDIERWTEERKTYIEASRESARTFDQAILTFGTAIFGASVAFIKDVAPHPKSSSLNLLGIAWLLFVLGLLAIMVSFLLSHRACVFEANRTDRLITEPANHETIRKESNICSTWTTWCNYISIALLFIGMVAWSAFAFLNIQTEGGKMTDPSKQPQREERGYVPAKPSPKTPTPPSNPQPPTQSNHQK